MTDQRGLTAFRLCIIILGAAAVLSSPVGATLTQGSTQVASISALDAPFHKHRFEAELLAAAQAQLTNLTVEVSGSSSSSDDAVSSIAGLMGYRVPKHRKSHKKSKHAAEYPLEEYPHKDGGYGGGYGHGGGGGGDKCDITVLWGVVVTLDEQESDNFCPVLTPQSEELPNEVEGFLEEVLADLGCPQAEATAETLSVFCDPFGNATVNLVARVDNLCLPCLKKFYELITQYPNLCDKYTMECEMLGITDIDITNLSNLLPEKDYGYGDYGYGHHGGYDHDDYSKSHDSPKEGKYHNDDSLPSLPYDPESYEKDDHGKMRHPPAHKDHPTKPHGPTQPRMARKYQKRSSAHHNQENLVEHRWRAASTAGQRAAVASGAPESLPAISESTEGLLAAASAFQRRLQAQLGWLTHN